MGLSPRFHLIAIILVLSGIMLFSYYADMMFLNWLLPKQTNETREILSLLGLIVATGIALFIFWEHWPEWYEDIEEDILHELTLHEESEIFRISLVLSILLTTILGILWRCYWPFLLGCSLFGTIICLYIVDIVTYIIIQGWEGISECVSDTAYSSLPGLWLAAFIILFLTTISSLIIYPGLCYPSPNSPEISSHAQNQPTTPESSFWKQIRQKIEEWTNPSKPEPKEQNTEKNSNTKNSTPTPQKNEETDKRK